MEIVRHREKTVVMQLAKSTGHTHMYHEEGDRKDLQVFPAVYLQKHNFNGSRPPDKIEITVKWEA